ncbi:hypothetical protein CEUSTIGMA_g11918.t1 [Chlamydomonas eustigma]|uniref:SF3 helicase domain-containing protein n=1 Tax=Chlamydomonas eustigma TaxID=1157962 RepID=A0A250XN48_9CHLO|nr:hypothetical protein CEUSTIGMA_g11918.t1 [Chlamydomonas eustigma]|eukprot:GAX84498.1 hypothetical protein CEUSTIGMA_g11918.t1 [Chlamydomonas eustigma]
MSKVFANATENSVERVKKRPKYDSASSFVAMEESMAKGGFYLPPAGFRVIQVYNDFQQLNEELLAGEYDSAEQVGEIMEDAIKCLSNANTNDNTNVFSHIVLDEYAAPVTQFGKDGKEMTPRVQVLIQDLEKLPSSERNRFSPLIKMKTVFEGRLAYEGLMSPDTLSGVDAGLIMYSTGVGVEEQALHCDIEVTPQSPGAGFISILAMDDLTLRVIPNSHNVLMDLARRIEMWEDDLELAGLRDKVRMKAENAAAVNPDDDPEIDAWWTKQFEMFIRAYGPLRTCRIRLSAGQCLLMHPYLLHGGGTPLRPGHAPRLHIYVLPRGYFDNKGAEAHELTYPLNLMFPGYPCTALESLVMNHDDLECAVSELSTWLQAAQASVDEGGIAGLLSAHALSPGGVREGLADRIQSCCRLASVCVAKDSGAEVRCMVQRALATLYYLEQAANASGAAHRVLTGPASLQISDDELVAGVARFSQPDDGENTNRFQQLVLYLLNAAQVRGYRRRGGELFRSVLPHAWERACDIRDFVYEVTRKEANFEMWLNLTCNRTNLQAAVEHLTQCRDVQLPDLVRDRHVFSFEDGIYLAREDRFVRRGTPECSALPESMVAAKHFAGRSFGRDDDTDTPNLQSILSYQDMSADVCRWMYALMGRLLYDVGDMDGWQVIPFLKGAASSGKSTILMRACRGFYEAGDVGTLSNNIERKFGLSALSDKLLFVGPEIKADIALEQAEFQSMVSGEAVQVAAKYKTAVTVDWKVPGVLAGNEVPGWVDNAGSINRRIVLFEFPKRVVDGDMELGRKIDLELPAILRRCNRAYLEAVRMHQKQNIWKVLPTAFHASKQEFAESVNSIVHYLRSGQLQVGGGDAVYMPFEVFASAYEAYVQSMGLTRMRLTGDRVADPLREHGCRVVKDRTMRYPRQSSSVRTGRFIIGCDFSTPGEDPLDD